MLIITLLVIAALILALLACFGVPSRAPLLALAVLCLAVVEVLERGRLL